MISTQAPTQELARPRTPRLLETKLRPPPCRAHAVVRDRLHDRLQLDIGQRLALVAAPAGSGKTTLLGMWREREADRRSIAWLTVDEGDNDPVVFWSYVLEALDRASVPIDLPATPDEVGASRLRDLLLPHVVNTLAAHGDTTLVLDDFHRLARGPSRDSVAWLVDHAPSTFQLLVSSRSEPGLPLAKLRAHGTLLELRAEELAFTRDEADQLLNDRLELGLEREYVADLVARTEGWPAGLYLAALSLRGADDCRALVSRFGGENRHVVDFLVDEVLDAHDPETQALMLRSSILERFCGPLCDAALEQQGSAAMLQRLSRSNLFLVPLDDCGEWYRFHHLFAQLLRAELEHREPGLASELHARAFAWHREHGSVDDAIHHALAAGLFSEAVDLIASGWVPYFDANRCATVAGWLEQLPPERRREEPLLVHVEAWVRALRGERDEADQALAVLERLAQLDSSPLPDGFSSLEASATTLRALIPWGDTGAGIANARRAAELEGNESPWRPVVAHAMGLGLYFSGEFEHAGRWLEDAVQVARRHQRWGIVSSLLAPRSLVAGELGQVDRQASLAEQAVEHVVERGSEAFDGDAFVALGASLAARGELDEALPLFDRGIAGLRSRGHTRLLADGLIRQAAALRAVDRHDAAVEAIAEARATVDACPDPGFLAERLAALERPRRPQRPDTSTAVSERERRILRMLGGTLSQREIGRELYLSYNTVHSHTKSIYRKLGVSSRSEALSRARELGII